MAKIREDLIGAVHVDGHVLFAGDPVPSGVAVGAHLTVAESKPAQDAAEKPKPKRGRPRKKAEPEAEADDAEVD